MVRPLDLGIFRMIAKFKHMKSLIARTLLMLTLLLIWFGNFCRLATACLSRDPDAHPEVREAIPAAILA